MALRLQLVISQSLFHLGLTAVASGISWWAGRVDLADEPDIIRTVCGDRDYSGIGVLC